MPKYKYTAKGMSGEAVSGIQEAPNEELLISILQNQGLFPIEIKTYSEDIPQLLKLQKIKIKRAELSQFIQQICDLTSSGVTLLRALEIVETQAESKNFKDMIHALVVSVKHGQKFSDALKAFPSIFSSFFINLVRSGESSGALDQVLMRLSDFAEMQEEIRSKVKAALAYPIFVACVGISVILALLVFVVPRMSSIFDDLGQKMPLLTKILINTSQFLIHYSWLNLILIIAFSLLINFLKKHHETKLFIHHAMLGLPFFGVIHRDNEISRFSRTLLMLLENGIPLVQALDIVHTTIENLVFQNEIQNLKIGISKGEKLREQLKKSQFLPLSVVNMLAIGEESGQLEKSLKRLADSFQKKVDRDIKLATSMLEPIMILIIGFFVGIIALAMLLPIFQINFLIR